MCHRLHHGRLLDVSWKSETGQTQLLIVADRSAIVAVFVMS